MKTKAGLLCVTLLIVMGCVRPLDLAFNGSSTDTDQIPQEVSSGLKKTKPVPVAESEESKASKAAKVELDIVADSVLTGGTGHQLTLTLAIDNQANQTIESLKGSIVVTDPFGEEVHSTKYSLLQPLGANQRHRRMLNIRIEPSFGGGRVLDYSSGMPLRARWKPERVLLKK